MSPSRVLFFEQNLIQQDSLIRTPWKLMSIPSNKSTSLSLLGIHDFEKMWTMKLNGPNHPSLSGSKIGGVTLINFFRNERQDCMQLEEIELIVRNERFSSVR